LSCKLAQAGKGEIVEQMGQLLEQAGMKDVLPLPKARVPVVKFVVGDTNTKVSPRLYMKRCCSTITSSDHKAMHTCNMLSLHCQTQSVSQLVVVSWYLCHLLLEVIGPDCLHSVHHCSISAACAGGHHCEQHPGHSEHKTAEGLWCHR